MTPPPPARVLMTTDAVGGVWQYSLALARWLGERGVEVLLAGLGPGPDAAQRAAAAAVPNLRYEHAEYRLEWMPGARDDVRRSAGWLLDLAGRFGPDLVHLNGYAHGALAWASPVLVVAHSCVLSWWRAVKGGNAPDSWDDYRRRVGAGLAAADLVVAPTRAMMASLAEHYGAITRARVIPNGLPGLPPARRPFVHSNPQKENVILSVGRLWDEAKNAQALARVAATLPWPVRLVGEAAAPGGEAGSFPNVELTGRLPAAATARHYAQAGIYALPARYEPFGLSVLEAAAAACALVLGDIPSLRENWDDAAWFVPPGDDEALHVALLHLCHDPAVRADLGRRARERAARFTLDAMGRNYLQAYAETTAAAQTRALSLSA